MQLFFAFMMCLTVLPLIIKLIREGVSGTCEFFDRSLKPNIPSRTKTVTRLPIKRQPSFFCKSTLKKIKNRPPKKIPSRELPYPTLGKGKSMKIISKSAIFGGYVSSLESMNAFEKKSPKTSLPLRLLPGTPVEPPRCLHRPT